MNYQSIALFSLLFLPTIFLGNEEKPRERKVILNATKHKMFKDEIKKVKEQAKKEKEEQERAKIDALIKQEGIAQWSLEEKEACESSSDDSSVGWATSVSSESEEEESSKNLEESQSLEQDVVTEQEYFLYQQRLIEASLKFQ